MFYPVSAPASTMADPASLAAALQLQGMQQPVGMIPAMAAPALPEGYGLPNVYQPVAQYQQSYRPAGGHRRSGPFLEYGDFLRVKAAGRAAEDAMRLELATRAASAAPGATATALAPATATAQPPPPPKVGQQQQQQATVSVLEHAEALAKVKLLEKELQLYREKEAAQQAKKREKIKKRKARQSPSVSNATDDDNSSKENSEPPSPGFKDVLLLPEATGPLGGSSRRKSAPAAALEVAAAQAASYVPVQQAVKRLPGRLVKMVQQNGTSTETDLRALLSSLYPGKPRQNELLVQLWQDVYGDSRPNAEMPSKKGEVVKALAAGIMPYVPGMLTCPK